MINVEFIGSYREPSVCFRGVSFVKGSPSSVSPEWLKENQDPRLKEIKPKKTTKKPLKVVSDGDS